MSVIVKGMEMPQNCNECDLSRRRHSSMGDIIDCKRIGTVGSAFNDPYMILIVRHPNCPLAKIKEPHGRLGDLDELKAHYRYSEADSEDERVWMMNIRRAITNAPTVIEAEGETDA